MTFKVLTLNNIALAGLERLPRDRYEVASEIGHPDAVHGALRGHAQDGDSRERQGHRARRRRRQQHPGGGDERRGVPVFNAPGANANAVKELVIGGMLLAARNLCEAWDYVRTLEGSEEELAAPSRAARSASSGSSSPVAASA
jgi:D-3-phosphoglycerate dehydrogenase / 2-oxoglutarate reductase